MYFSASVVCRKYYICKIFFIYFTAITCDVLVLGSQLKVDSTEVSFNTEVTFSCEAGYELTGTEKITCGANGWSDTNIPTCGGIIIHNL